MAYSQAFTEEEGRKIQQAMDFLRYELKNNLNVTDVYMLEAFKLLTSKVEELNRGNVTKKKMFPKINLPKEKKTYLGLKRGTLYQYNMSGDLIPVANIEGVGDQNE